MAAMLLDTTVLIDALRGRPAGQRVRELRRAGDVPYVCAVNVEELWRGARPEEEEVLARLVRGLRTAPLGAAEGALAGRWRRDFSARGVTLHQADCLIAAAAVGVDASLATGNPDHFPMPELAVQHWAVGD